MKQPMGLDAVIARLDDAFDFVGRRTIRRCEHDDIWDLRFDWPTRKAEIAQALLDERYVFSPCRAFQYKPGAYLHTYRTQDKVVLKAMAMALSEGLPRSRCCFSYKGHGGVAGAKRYVATRPDVRFGFKTDVADYYATIDWVRLLLRLAPYVEAPLQRLVYLSLQRAGVKRGIPRGSALSFVLGNFYLHELDVQFEGRPHQHYCRYMDDILVLTPTRRALRRASKTVMSFMAADAINISRPKTFIGRAGRDGFRLFLGSPLPHGLIDKTLNANASPRAPSAPRSVPHPSYSSLAAVAPNGSRACDGGKGRVCQ